MTLKNNKVYTVKDLESSKNTIVKFLREKRVARLDMIKEAYEYYIKNTRNWKPNRIKGKFTRMFINSVNFYNSIKK